MLFLGGCRLVGKVLERLELIGADSAERRVDDLLKALGFTDEVVPFF
jgi:hypothetical protein